MEVHLVLKTNPENRPSPIFQRSKDDNKIVFPKFQTQFNFKSISYPEEDVFTKVVSPLIKNKFFNGEDSLLITLGPTNSGKSHLLFKNENSVVDQSLKFIFENIEPLSNDVGKIRRYYPEIFDARIPDSTGDVSCDSFHYLSVSMFELYNDNILDLLHPNPKTLRENSTIVTDPIDAKLTPRNISKSLVNSYESLHNLIYNGLTRRKTCPTFANNVSSRSHCFIFLNLHKVYANVLETTRFTIVDLAGLERSKSAGTTGLALREASYTNASLTELGRCFELISMKQFYKTCLRTNKLTRLVLNDYVKLSHPICIMVTLDPFGEEGLILQTLRYIDPIKYQHLQRKSLSKFPSRSKSISKTDQSGLIKEIENLRQSQKLLKTKVHSLEEFIVENENQIRSQLYEENEQNLAKVMMDHKEEVSKLTQSFICQADKKLQDQSDSFRAKYDELHQLMELKQSELNFASKEFEDKQLELENLQSDYKQLKETLNTLKTSNLKVVDELKQKLEESNSSNDNLKVELETLHLKMTDFEASRREETEKTENERSVANEKLQIELEQSKNKIADLENVLESLRETAFSSEIQNENLAEARANLEKNVDSLKIELDRKDAKLESLCTEHERELRKLSEVLSLKEVEISSYGTKLKSLRLELEQQQKENTEMIEALRLNVNSLEEKVNKAETEKVKAIDQMKQLKTSSELESNFLKQQLEEKEQNISTLETAKKSLLQRFEISISEKDKEIEQAKNELKKAREEYGNKISSLKEKLESKKLELQKVEENSKKLEGSENFYETSIAKLNKELDSLKLLFNQEVEKSTSLKSEFEASTMTKNESIGRLTVETKFLSETVKSLQNELKLKTSENHSISLSTKNAEEELAKLQLLCSDLKSELAEKEKFVEKYTELKLKNSEYSGFVKKLQYENENTRKELRDKTTELEKCVRKVARLTEKVTSLEAKQVGETGSKSSPELHNAISLSGEQPIDKTPRKALNLLDTDPLDDLGLPSIMSSPLKPPSFQIHSDQVEKDNTISLGATQHKKKKKNRKLSKQEQLLHQKQIHERKMMDSYESSKSNKSNKFKFKALSSANGSELNRKALPNGSNPDSKAIKKRKSLSPLKPSKKKVRRSVTGEDSLDLLE